MPIVLTTPPADVARLDGLPLTKELVEGLDKLFPERCPNLGQSMESIWHYAGTRQLVRALLAAHARQQEQDLSPDNPLNFIKGR